MRLTLNRPGKRNAISVEMTHQLEQLVDWLEGSDLRVVIVSGAGGTFCAGDDVGDIPTDPQEARELSIRRGRLYQQITELPQIFIAAIDGLAVGGGFVLAAACDLRVATQRTKLGLPEVRLGWPPNYGLGIVTSLLGRGRTLELSLTADIVEARRAEAIGFVTKVVSPVQLESTVHALAGRLLSLPPTALRLAKQQLSPQQHWRDEVAADTFVDCLTGEEAKKSIAKFK